MKPCRTAPPVPASALAATALLAGAALPACGGAEEAAGGAPIEQLSGFVGSWKGTHRVAGDDVAHPATYEIRVSDDGNAMIWEFASEWNGGFSGRAVQAWDARNETWVETWTESSSDQIETMPVAWDEETQTLTGTTPGEVWDEPGTPATFDHRTQLHGDSFDYVMTMTPDGEEAREVVWVHMEQK